MSETAGSVSSVPRRPAARSRRLIVFALGLIGAALLAGCSLGAPAGPPNLRYRDPIFSNVTEQAGIPYATADDAAGNLQTYTLDMYTPTGDTQTSRPAIVLVHGGGFRGGTSTNNVMVALANAFAQRGYVAVSINYPLLAGGHICAKENPPSQTCVDAAFAAQHAAQAAIRFLRANASTYSVDASRIAVEGASAGAVTALAVAINANDPGTDGNPNYPSNADAAISISGELPPSYTSLANSTDAPVLMFNGTADQTVPYSEGVQTAGDLYNAGVPIIFEELNGAGHVPWGTDSTFLTDQSVYFAYYVMHLDKAAGQPTSAHSDLKRQEQKTERQYPGITSALRRQGRLR
jgi:para-nitrobenzyl esterase